MEHRSNLPSAAARPPAITARNAPKIWVRAVTGEWFGRYDDAKYTAVLAESAPRFIYRTALLFFGVILIAGQLWGIAFRDWRSLHHALGISWIVFVALWTFVAAYCTIRLFKARAAHREKSSKAI